MVFKTPVEIPCTYKIEQPELKSYDKSKQLGTYMKTGKLTIGVYQETLVELDVEIKKGDYIGVQISPEHMEFFVVNNDGKNNYDNAHTLWGTVPLYRTVQCSPVDQSEFKASSTEILSLGSVTSVFLIKFLSSIEHFCLSNLFLLYLPSLIN